MTKKGKDYSQGSNYHYMPYTWNGIYTYLLTENENLIIIITTHFAGCDDDFISLVEQV